MAGDVAAVEPDRELITQLTGLRRGRGLTLDALSQAPAVLALLGDVPLAEALDRLVTSVTNLGGDEQARALQNAYAIGWKDPEMLTDRRVDFKQATGRDRKTQIAYEDRQIRELSKRLVASRGSAHEVAGASVYVIADVSGYRIGRMQVTVRLPQTDSPDVSEHTTEYTNRMPWASFPALIYQLPPDWRPAVLTLVVRFEDVPRDERRVYGAASAELLSLLFAEQASEIPLDPTTPLASIEIKNPKPGILYAVYWLG